MSYALSTETDTLPDGSTRTVTIYPDDLSIFDCEGDWYGELADTDSHRDPHTGYSVRPSHFTGRARKISPSQMREGYWWQPPADVKDSDLPAMQSTICGLLDYGYVIIEVEVTTPDGYTGTASIGGIGSFDNEGPTYYTEHELTPEATAEAEAARNRHLARLTGTSPAYIAAIYAA